MEDIILRAGKGACEDCYFYQSVELCLKLSCRKDMIYIKTIETPDKTPPWQGRG